MDIDKLNLLHEKIIFDGLKINDPNLLNDLYSTQNFEYYENEFKSLIRDCYPKDKMKYAFVFYIGFLNVYLSDVDTLPNITKFESYSFLKGYLMQYFKGHLNINYNYSIVSPYHNYYSFVEEWWPFPFSIPQSLIKLLKWIYEYDKNYFFELMFNEKHNYLFMSLFKGEIVDNLKILVNRGKVLKTTPEIPELPLNFYQKIFI